MIVETPRAGHRDRPKMIREHVFLTETQARELKQLADRTGVKKAVHVRLAVDRYLRREGLQRTAKPPKRSRRDGAKDRAGGVAADV